MFSIFNGVFSHPSSALVYFIVLLIDWGPATHHSCKIVLFYACIY